MKNNVYTGNDFLVRLGSRIREQREYKKMSRDELAEQVDISSRFMAYIEQGKKGMALDTLLKITDALNVTPDYLLLNITKENDVSHISSLLKECDAEKLKKIESIIRICKEI